MSRDESKGFSGLRNLVSNIENDQDVGGGAGNRSVGKNLGEDEKLGGAALKDEVNTEGKEKSEKEKSSKTTKDNYRKSSSNNNKHSTKNEVAGDGFHVFVIVVIVLIVFGFIAYISERNKIERPSPTVEVNQNNKELNIGQSSSKSEESSVDDASVIDIKGLTFQRPAPGNDNILSMPELRWCSRVGIIIETIRPHVDTNDLVDMFNELISINNERCGSFRYKNNDYNVAVQQVEEIRNFIQESALRTLFLEREESEEGATQQSVTQEQIQEAQRLLSALGYSVGPIDGIFGPRTRQAILSYYEEKGIEYLDPVVTQMLLVWLRSDA